MKSIKIKRLFAVSALVGIMLTAVLVSCRPDDNGTDIGTDTSVSESDGTHAETQAGKGTYREDDDVFTRTEQTGESEKATETDGSATVEQGTEVNPSDTETQAVTEPDTQIGIDTEVSTEADTVKPPEAFTLPMDVF